MKYPHWAPRALIAKRQDIESDFAQPPGSVLPLPQSKSITNVLDQLLTDDRLITAWGTIDKQSKTNEYEELSVDLCRLILRSLLYADSFADSVSVAKRNQELSLLQSRVRRLRSGIKQLHLPNEFFPVYFKRTKRVLILPSREPIPPGVVDNASVLEILNDLEDVFEGLLGFEGCLNTAIKDRERRNQEILIAFLHNFFKERLDSWLDSTVACFVGVLFESPVSSESVRKRRGRAKSYDQLSNPARWLWNP